MEHILSVLMEVSIYSAVIAVTVLAVRKCFAKRMNPAFMIALWAVVLVRFCLPVTLESPVHFDALFPSNAVESVSDTPMSEVYEGVYNAQTPNIANDEIPTPAAMPSVPQSNTAVLPRETVPEAKPISPYALIMGIWFAGAAGVILVFAVKAIHLAVYVRRSPKLFDRDTLSVMREKKTQLGIKRNVTVKVCNKLYAPALYGVFRPVILLPEKYLKMSAYDLEAIFAHELMHLKKHDILLGYVWLIVKAVHWFNPLVWIAYSKYLEDIELCRDSQAAALVEDGAIHYGSALLNAARLAEFTSDTVLPAASLFKKKSALKERVVRMVKPQKRSKAFSAVSAFVIVIAAMLCFTTACQPTPDGPIVIGKGNVDYSENTTPSTDSTQSITSTDPTESFPSAWSDSFTIQDRLEVKVDAEVVTNGMAEFPVTEVAPGAFSNEHIQKIKDYFIGDNEYTATGRQLTKAEWTERLIEYKAQASNPNHEYDPEQVKILEESIRNAPETVEEPIADFSSESVSVEFDLGHVNMAEFTMLNKQVGGIGNRIDFRDGSGYFYEIFEPIDESQIGITKEFAIQKAKELIEHFEITDVDVASVIPGVKDKSGSDGNAYCYIVYFTRNDDGIFMTKDYNDLNSEKYAAQWEAEQISVGIDKNGIFEFHWEYISKPVSKINENIELLPFEDIQRRFMDQMKINYADVEHTNEIQINKAQLGYMRVAQQGDLNSGIWIPVWDFYGPNIVEGPDGVRVVYDQNYRSYLTINAVDGSIIDRGLGY